MKSLMKTSLLTIAMSTLVACGGGGSDTKTETPPVSVVTPPKTELTKIHGMAIDGYLVGATMFMDLNFNGELDDGEPNTVTKEPSDSQDPSLASSWTLEVPVEHEDCGQYVPMVVHVPAGAIDLDFPDTPIEEAYTIVYPPSFAVATDTDLINVTPLTTVIWNVVEKELQAAQSKELSCASIVEEQELRKVIDQRLRDQEKRVAQRYNVTVDELYSDFVSTANTELHGVAQSLVPGLAKSYEETLVVEKANPDASYAYVEYYLDTTWNRLEYVKHTEGNWMEQTNEVSSDLEKVGALISKYQQRTSIRDGLEFQLAVSLVNNVCTVAEYYTESDGEVGYALANIAGALDVDWNTCIDVDRVANNLSQEFITKTFYSDGDTVKTESAHSYGVDNEFRYNELIGADTSQVSGGWLSSNLNHISLSFEDDYGYDADSWYRIDNRYDSEEFWNATQEVHMHNSQDEYTVTTYNPDGTYSKQCGTWSGGTGSLTGC